MRLLLASVVAMLAAAPALSEAPYYGPKQGAFGTGYKESLEKDGAWRIVTEYHDRFGFTAMDVALYRAADLARQAGQPYVQILGASATGGYGVTNGFIFAKASDSAAAPADCRPHSRKSCYTASVAQVIAALSGPGGDTPGVAKPSGVDKYGRQVTIEGIGIGAVAWAQP